MGISAAAPGRPFFGVLPSFLPRPLAEAFLAGALLRLSMISIDLVVAVPLALAWSGVFTELQAITAVFAALIGRSILSPSFLRVVAPSRVTPAQADRWLKDRPFSALARRLLPAAVFVLLLNGLPAGRRATEAWAGRNGADADATFALLCIGAVTSAAGLALVARRRLGIGVRASDDPFTEAFWALLTVVVALVPVALRLSWAPTMLAALAFPLLVVRWRIAVSRRTARPAQVTSWIRVQKPRSETHKESDEDDLKRAYRETVVKARTAGRQLSIMDSARHRTGRAFDTWKADLGLEDSQALATIALALGASKQDSGEVDDAKAAYMRAIDSGDPQIAPAAAMALGFMLRGVGDLDGARAAYERAAASGHPEHASEARQALDLLSCDSSSQTSARTPDSSTA